MLLILRGAALEVVGQGVGVGPGTTFTQEGAEPAAALVALQSLVVVQSGEVLLAPQRTGLGGALPQTELHYQSNCDILRPS